MKKLVVAITGGTLLLLGVAMVALAGPTIVMTRVALDNLRSSAEEKGLVKAETPQQDSHRRTERKVMQLAEDPAFRGKKVSD